MKGDWRGQGRWVGGGGWLLRAAVGFTGRANSALATGDPGMPLADAVAEVCRWYTVRAGRRDDLGRLPHRRSARRSGGPVPRGPRLAGALRRRDRDDRRVRDRGRRYGGRDRGRARRPGRRARRPWLARYRFRGQALPPIARRLLLSAPWQRFASVREAGRTIAVGRLAVADGWAGLTAVEVDPAHRRRGLGRAITGALAAAAGPRRRQPVPAGPGRQLRREDAVSPGRLRRPPRLHYRVAPGSPGGQRR